MSMDPITEALEAIKRLKAAGFLPDPEGTIPTAAPVREIDGIVGREITTHATASAMTEAEAVAALKEALPKKPRRRPIDEVAREVFAGIMNHNPVPSALEALIPTASFYRPNLPILRRIAMALKRNRNILMVGQAGTGKSSFVEYICHNTKTPLLRINFNGQTTSGELIGHYIVKDGATHWIEGVLPFCMRNGVALLLDEVDCADPGVLALLHPVLEPNGRLILKEHDNEIIHPASGFRIFATANSLGIHDDSGLYTGTNAMNHAFLSRWTGVALEFPSETEETQIFIGHGIRPDIADRIAKASVAIRKMINDDRSVVGVWGTRHAIDFGQFTEDSGSFNVGFQTASGLKFSKNEERALWETIQRITGDTVPALSGGGMAAAAPSDGDDTEVE